MSIVFFIQAWLNFLVTPKDYDLTGFPRTTLLFDPKSVRPQWYHPLLEIDPQQIEVNGSKKPVGKQILKSYTYDYYLRFLPFFRNQPEGNLKPGVNLEVSARMRHKLGQAELFVRVIKLNQNYFSRDPRLLPYSLFHEMVHLWLYDCYLDPGHTKRFYRKMDEFSRTGLPVDPDVHIHERLSQDSRYIYACHRCQNRWYLNSLEKDAIYCGYCLETSGEKYIAGVYKNPSQPSPARDRDLSYFSKEIFSA